MNFNMRTKIFFLAVFFGVLGLAKSSSAATINAASASYADVSAAVAAADYNDTVRVPAGEENWGNNTLTITKGIKLLGAGKTQTIINSAPTTYSYDKFLIYFNADSTTAANDYQFKLDGFYLKANGTEPPHALLYLNNSHLGDHLTKVIISNNKFKQIAGTLPYSGRTRMAIYLNLAVFGVTYNNEIIDGTHAWRFLGRSSTGKNVGYWEPGSQYAMYFEENNIYISEDWNANMIISGGAGNRYVSRYNTFDLSARGSSDYTQAHDIHGNQENNPGAGIGYEAYGEHRIGGQGEFFDNRAGRVHFFMNKW